MQLVVFALNEEEYGFDLSAVNSILRAKKFQIKTIPGTSKVIEGMINVRGQVNYILNLRPKFGLEPKEFSEESKFIMLNVSDANTCCIVDEVTDIVKLEDDDIHSAPTFVSGVNARYIKGIGKLDDRMIIILDPNQILSVDEYATMEKTGS
jgi:purine-binding chemotaxis protein CheW